MSPPGTDATDAEHFGFVLWALRLSAGFSRAKLAKRAGLAEATIKWLEAGKGFPSTRTLYRLMSVPALRLTPAILQELFAASSLVDVEYAVERPARVGPDQTQIVLRLTLAFKDRG
jgi:transcriptional regulator with XRE-family HTH domain